MNKSLFTGLAKDTTDTITDISSQAISTSFNYVTGTFDDLINFLISRNVLTTAIGIMMATQISSLTTTLSEAIITPLLNGLLGNKVADLETYEFTIFSIKFKFGLLISKLISFSLVVFVIYNIWKLSQIKLNLSLDNPIKSDNNIKINVTAK